jgi:hypothetical protein
LFYLSTQRARIGRLDEALEHLTAAESEFAGQANPLWQSRCALARAALLLANGESADLREATTLCRRAARVFARLGHPSRQAVAGAILARAQLSAGRSRAEEEARSALWLAQGLGVPWHMSKLPMRSSASAPSYCRRSCGSRS